MKKLTKQHRLWLSDFGDEYLERNLFNPSEFDKSYQSKFGITRTEMNKEFLGGLDKRMRILEVGCNYGLELLMLQKLGFKNLYGMEINPKIVEFSKKRVHNMQIIWGDALDIPFKDNYFDLVFTSGVLIHIAPPNVKRAMAEIHRVSGKYIWGFEYFAPKSTEIFYHGRKGVLWKADFAKMYGKFFKDLRLTRFKLFKYLGGDNQDAMFLLRK